MSLKARLDAAFNQFTVAKRAEETTRALNDYSNQPKEIHSHFTELVDRIFTSSGWGMHDLTLQNKKDFEAIMTFLGPTGVFLNVINKLQLDPFLRYTMPTIVSIFYWVDFILGVKDSLPGTIRRGGLSLECIQIIYLKMFSVC